GGAGDRRPVRAPRSPRRARRPRRVARAAPAAPRPRRRGNRPPAGARRAGRGVTARIAVFTSAAPATDVIRLAVQQDADLLLLATRGDPLAGSFAAVFADAACDVATLVADGGALR